MPEAVCFYQSAGVRRRRSIVLVHGVQKNARLRPIAAAFAGEKETSRLAYSLFPKTAADAPLLPGRERERKAARPPAEARLPPLSGLASERGPSGGFSCPSPRSFFKRFRNRRPLSPARAPPAATMSGADERAGTGADVFHNISVLKGAPGRSYEKSAPRPRGAFGHSHLYMFMLIFQGVGAKEE